MNAMPLPPDTRANLERFWSTIEASAEIGKGRPGGLARLTLTDDDKKMRDLFADWCQEAGLALTIDELGNMFARRDGQNNDLSPLSSLAATSTRRSMAAASTGSLACWRGSNSSAS
jgi:N-carbamoyl-L-amino-acid hydrolase